MSEMLEVFQPSKESSNFGLKKILTSTDHIAIVPTNLTHYLFLGLDEMSTLRTGWEAILGAAYFILMTNDIIGVSQLSLKFVINFHASTITAYQTTESLMINNLILDLTKYEKIKLLEGSLLLSGITGSGGFMVVLGIWARKLHEHLSGDNFSQYVYMPCSVVRHSLQCNECS